MKSRIFPTPLAVLPLLFGLAFTPAGQAGDGFKLGEAKWDSEKVRLTVKGEGDDGEDVTVSNAATQAVIGSDNVDDHTWRVREYNLASVPCRVRAEQSNGEADERDVENAPSNCDNGGSGGTAANFAILAANDLGMHCADQDYRIFSILPPYNVLNAQVVQKGAQPLLMSPADGIEVVYSAIAGNIVDPNDPNLPPIATDSITTTSANAAGLFKSNFWDQNPATGHPYGVDSYDNLFPPGLLGNAPFLLELDLGLPAPDVVELYLGPDGVPGSGDEFLTAHQIAMPGISDPYLANEAQHFGGYVENFPFFLNFPFGYLADGFNRYTAEGIPTLSTDDQGREQAYPLMRVEARDSSTQQVLAHVDVTVPVASEADCQQCHATQNVCDHQSSYTLVCDDIANADPNINFIEADINGVFSESVPGDNAEQRVINAAKINILRLHDAKHATGLDAERSVVCANCHYSPALDLAHLGPNDANGKQQTQHISMSRAMHGFHGNLKQQSEFSDLFPNMPPPGAERSIAMQEQVLGETCYQCHPGKRSKCLRGAMANGGITCQDCHGQMAQVGNDFTGNFPNINFPNPGSADLSKRVSWAEEPKCQSCHVGDVFQVAQQQANFASGELLFNATDKDGNADGLRLHMAYTASDHLDNGGSTRLNLLDFSESRFASNKALFRLSGGNDGSGKGHNGMSCEGCHGSTHAIWPARNELATDNQNALGLQGHTGPIIECDTCHEGDLGNTLGGPHGMHPVGRGQFADGGHEHMAEQNPDACRACHGVNGEGTVLSRMATDRTLECDNQNLPGCNSNKRITLSRGSQVSCTLCHANKL